MSRFLCWGLGVLYTENRDVTERARESRRIWRHLMDYLYPWGDFESVKPSCVLQSACFRTYTCYFERVSAFTLTSTATCSVLRDLDGGFKMDKMVSIERWMLLNLNGHHLGCRAEGEGPPTYFQPVGGGWCNFHVAYCKQVRKIKNDFIFKRWEK